MDLWTGAFRKMWKFPSSCAFRFFSHDHSECDHIYYQTFPFLSYILSSVMSSTSLSFFFAVLKLLLSLPTVLPDANTLLSKAFVFLILTS